MKDVKRFERKYFDSFRDTPLKLVPFLPIQKEIARMWVEKIENHMKGIDVKVCHRGSTLFEICGKGDIDVAVYTSTIDYEISKKRLILLFGSPRVEDRRFSVFYLIDQDYEVEISLMKGYEAKVDQGLTKELMSRPDLVKKYEQLKVKYAYSKREYLYQRSKFFKIILKSIA